MKTIATKDVEVQNLKLIGMINKDGNKGLKRDQNN